MNKNDRSELLKKIGHNGKFIIAWIDKNDKVNTFITKGLSIAEAYFLDRILGMAIDKILELTNKDES